MPKADDYLRDDQVILQRSHADALELVRGVAERICQKLEHPTASVTIFDQTDLRAALDAAQRS